MALGNDAPPVQAQTSHSNDYNTSSVTMACRSDRRVAPSRRPGRPRPAIRGPLSSSLPKVRQFSVPVAPFEESRCANLSCFVGRSRPCYTGVDASWKFFVMVIRQDSIRRFQDSRRARGRTGGAMRIAKSHRCTQFVATASVLCVSRTRPGRRRSVKLDRAGGFVTVSR